MTITLSEAIDALRHREPFDENETMCGVSREALDVVLAYVGRRAASDDDVECACHAFATATDYYVPFHPGLSSVSADKLRAGMRAALASLPAPTAEADGMERAAKVCDDRVAMIDDLAHKEEDRQQAMIYRCRSGECRIIAAKIRALASQPPQARTAMPSEGE